MVNPDKNNNQVDNTDSTLSSPDKLPNFLKGSADALESTVSVVMDEVINYSTEGKTYSTLCLEAKKFHNLFKSLNTLNEGIKGADRKRKEAIKNSPRPVSKVRNDAFLKRVKNLTQAEFDELKKSL